LVFPLEEEKYHMAEGGVGGSMNFRLSVLFSESYMD
jgi:hypothetical protein